MISSKLQIWRVGLVFLWIAIIDVLNIYGKESVKVKTCCRWRNYKLIGTTSSAGG
jgi:hypothetical protein